MVRINKYLANCGFGSRRKVEYLIANKTVTVNEELCTNLATQIDPHKDVVRVNNQIVTYKFEKIFIILNKPRGYIVTKKDEFNRKTVYDLLPEFANTLHPVGRLDYDSEGLLILTNDGDITNKITHPIYNIEKTYKVIVKGQVSMDNINKLRSGVEIDKYITQSAKVFINDSNADKSELKITIKEGKNRQIRKMLDSIGHEIISLKRIQIGHIKLEKLPIGNWRFLADKEILSLLKQLKKTDGKK